ncbi:DUF6643 family protein [Streptomyces sp. NPDC002536]
MTSPRSAYGGGYYATSSFKDTPIYDSLVAERGTPQIAPIRVSSPYDFSSNSNLPALPALPSGPSAAPAPQYAAPAPQPGPVQPMGLQQAAAPYIPPQASAPRGYPGPAAGPAGYDAMRPVAPRPAPASYEDPYNRPYPQQGGY